VTGRYRHDGELGLGFASCSRVADGVPLSLLSA
jgi:hypothetical protein